MEQLRNGEIDPETAAASDRTAGMMVQYFVAMTQGAAFRNLQLLAQVLAYSAKNVEDGQDEFVRWSDAIGGLTKQEIVFLAGLWRIYSETSPDHSNENDLLKPARERVHRELVGPGKVCKNFDEFQEVGYALLRTGFVMMVSLIGGFNSFRPAPRLLRLVQMADLNSFADEKLDELKS
jgi:hypothetical protein